MDLLPPKNDFVFKRIFGDEHNTDILLDFLNSLLLDVNEAPIENLEILNPILEKDGSEEKFAILDVRARSTQGDQFDVEVQIINQHDIEKRSLYYWGRLYTGQLVSGRRYRSLRRAVAVNILDFAYLPGEAFHSLYQMREHRTHHLLSSDAEMHFVELPKLKQATEDPFSRLFWWGLFLRGLREDQMEVFRMQNPSMKKAVDVLEILSQDEAARIRYESRQKALLDEQSRLEGAREDGLLQGIQQGKQEGIQQGKLEGKQEGIQEEKRQLTQRLIQRGMPDKEIAQLVDMPVKEVRQLRQSTTK